MRALQLVRPRRVFRIRIQIGLRTLERRWEETWWAIEVGFYMSRPGEAVWRGRTVMCVEAGSTIGETMMPYKRE